MIECKPCLCESCESEAIEGEKIADKLAVAMRLIDQLHNYSVGASFLSEEKPAADYAKLMKMCHRNGDVS